MRLFIAKIRQRTCHFPHFFYKNALFSAFSKQHLNYAKASNNITINCDMGEGFSDDLVMPYVDLANIACGGHIDDKKLLQKTIKLAHQYKTKIGAHISYPDKKNFGRVKMNISLDNLLESIQTQLDNILKFNDNKIYHIKPHGALYHTASSDFKLFQQILFFAKKTCAKLIVPFNLHKDLREEANIQNIILLNEAFADRAYDDNGNLLKRTKTDSILSDPQKINEQFDNIKNNNLTSITGHKINYKADTICFHSDNSPSLIALQKIKNA
ncbi:MAG: lactam utilization protein LamB [Gammaproteobacteria bacterium]|nr:MAG: lactam utilization protein LamB [Gammaproteobacteria bacterium]